MNIESLSAIAEKKIELSDTALAGFRKEQLALFQQKGMKEIYPDSYKFTNLHSFFESLQYEPKNFEGDLPSFAADIPTITFTDGEVTSAENLPEGITLKKMQTHFRELQDHFKDDNALSHLHHSLTNDGVILEVAKNVEVNTPVRFLNIQTKSTITAPTNLVITNAFSSITLIEENRALDGISHASIPETYLVARTGSKIEHIVLELENNQGLSHSSVSAEVDKDASVRSVFLNASGKMNRKNLTLNLNAPGAHGETYSLFLTEKNEHSDIFTVINHKSADTTSDQIAKGILDGDSKGVFTGKIHIHPKAQRVASGQLNKNLLLSKKAQVHSQPQLEIFADDVKCSHGSTTGQLSPDEVFYFQARGIPEDKAKNLLALGFGLEIVQKIGNPMAREHALKIIREKLTEKFSLGGLI